MFNYLNMKALLFDLWGTLAYLEDGIDFVGEIALALGINKSKYIDFVVNTWYKEGLSPKGALERLSSKFGTKPDLNIIGLLYEPLKRARLYPDVIHNLERLRNQGMLVLVSDTTPVGRGCINKLNITNYFNSLHFSFDYGFTKKEGLYKKVIDELRLYPSNCIVIGNSMNSDYRQGVKIGAKSILVDRENKHKGVKKVLTLDEL